MTEFTRVAVLIDCDNVSHRWAREILAETATHGALSIKRGYGDWTGNHLKGWRERLPEYAIQPVLQLAYSVGKNSSDFSLVIDAMDLLYSENVDVFCIVSSDSDFTRLAMRLRESGKRVYGIGARKTPEAFQKACDRFTYLEVIVEGAVPESPVRSPAKVAKKAATSVAKKAAKTPAKKATTPQLQEPASLLLPAIEANAKDDGWASLASEGQYVVNTNPTFDSRNYGYAKLSDLVRDVPQVELNEVSAGNGLSTLYVRAAARRTRKRS